MVTHIRLTALNWVKLGVQSHHIHFVEIESSPINAILRLLKKDHRLFVALAVLGLRTCKGFSCMA